MPRFPRSGTVRVGTVWKGWNGPAYSGESFHCKSDLLSGLNGNVVFVLLSFDMSLDVFLSANQ